MRALKAFIVVLLALAAALIRVAFMLPRRPTSSVRFTIAWPASEAFAVVDGYRRCNAWSSGAAKDPNARTRFPVRSAG